MEKWLKELNNEIIDTFHHLDLYKKLSEIINGNSAIKTIRDKAVLVWMKKAFTADLVMRLGQICDDTGGTKSLVKFLQKLKNSKELISRERYIKRFENFHPQNTITRHMIKIQNEHFDRMAGEGLECYTDSKINEDIAKLKDEPPCKNIILFRNEYIAHFGKVRNIAPKYEELYEAFKIIEKIAKKYNLIINGAHIKLAPTMQGDWEEVFTVPWIEKVEQAP